MTLSCRISRFTSYMLCSDLLLSHLYDTQPSQFGGIKNEFIFSPRMDNQFSSYVTYLLLLRPFVDFSLPLGSVRWTLWLPSPPPRRTRPTPPQPRRT